MSFSADKRYSGILQPLKRKDKLRLHKNILTGPVNAIKKRLTLGRGIARSDSVTTASHPYARSTATKTTMLTGASSAYSKKSKSEATLATSALTGDTSVSRPYSKDYNLESSLDTDDFYTTIGSEEADEIEYTTALEDDNHSFHLPLLPSCMSSSQWAALLTMWHLLMVNISAAFLVLGIVLRFLFSYFVIKDVNSLDMFSSYERFMKKADKWTTKLEFSDHEQVIGEMLITCHSFYFTAHVVFLAQATFKSQFTLPFATLVSGCVVLAEISLINVFLSPDIISRQEVVKALQKKLLKYATNSEDKFIMSYEYMSVWLKCCGIVDRWDFQDIEDFHWIETNSTNKVPLFVAPTCCKREIFRIDYVHGPSFRKVISCADSSGELNNKQYTTGCFAMLLNYIQTGCDYYALVAWIHLCDLAIHAVLYRKRVVLMAEMLAERKEMHKHLLVPEAVQKLTTQERH